MKVLRSIIWVLAIAVLVAFTVANWVPVEVRIWQGLVLDTKLPALVIFAFLAGLVPTWLVYRATRWRLAKRIATLEANLSAPTASLSSTQLDQAAQQSTETP
ncbi:DUF1049 domain-containing protein [Novosphingobium huizhouense]|uniref:DUF1049 domain-containing protein n=1 Tax=Novosphingobium huizhouense TaxID=2866625 RepID=UPI001CD8F799|nr:DUF1049 domain-containing protein [Novosphingobium huizhouense]